MKLSIKSALLVGAIALGGCSPVDGVGGVGGGGGGGGNNSTTSNSHIYASELVQKINSRSTDYISLEKEYAVRDGWIVVYDSYYGYRAIDLDYLNDAGYSIEEAADDYVDGTFITNEIELSVTSIGYGEFEDVYGNIYEEATLEEKDLATITAVLEEVNSKRLGEDLALEFGLSEDQGLRVARLAQQWERLSDSRAMSEADVDAISSELFGIDIKSIRQAEKAFQDGDLSKVDALMNEAAEALDTTPENFQTIINELM